MTDDDLLLSVAEAAERLGRKPVSVRALVARGKLHPVYIDGRTYLLRISEIDERVEARKDGRKSTD